MKRVRVSLFAIAVCLTVFHTVTAASAATETVLYGFHPTLRGQYPSGGLISDAKGNLFGVTSSGGRFDCGTVFELSPNSNGDWTETVLYSFCSHPADGWDPVGSLLADASGNLYGATSWGGSSGVGTIFKLSISGGKWAESVLWNFQQSNSRDGFNPQGGLVLDKAGNLYGTTEYGGGYSQVECSFDGGCGTVFRLSPESGGRWQEKILYVFQGTDDGSYPNDALAVDASGNLYGTTRAFEGSGTVFKLAPTLGGAWSETTIYSFTGGADGFGPGGGLIFDASGNLYGTAFGGGNRHGFSGNACGVVFELVPGSGNQWSETVLFSFNGDDGKSPDGKLIFDQSGNLYGTTYFGGAFSEGVVFQLLPGSGGQWTESVLWNFAGTGDGQNPAFGVIAGASGQLFGASAPPIGEFRIFNPNGAVFELRKKADGDWKETTLTNFPYSDGGLVQSAVVADPAGNLYGTTSRDGGYGSGTVFELTQSAGGWNETAIYNFRPVPGGPSYQDPSSLVFDAAGNLYGETEHGGTSGLGTVFELSPGSGGVWMEKDLFTFTSIATGEGPFGGLIFDAQGNLYGTTQSGGIGCSTGCGTVFKLTPANGAWTETVLYRFAGGSDGEHPVAGLTFDQAGNLYGTTSLGGSEISCGEGCGTVFELSPASGGGWTETTLYAFKGSGGDGAMPRAGLILDPAGNLYGTTLVGGVINVTCGGTGCGTVFELSPTSGAWNEKILHKFTGSDDIFPVASLIMDDFGNLYGTTEGGVGQWGTVFELSPSSGGSWSEKTLYSFPPTFAGDTDGYFPEAALTFSPDGTLYGTTAGGGAGNGGTVFAIK